jgi:molecular chaperone GrpE (heat shock protein)
MNEAVAKSDEFTSAMQQLIAEAAKNAPPEPHLAAPDREGGPAQMELHELNARVQNLEKTLAERVANLASGQPGKPGDLGLQLQKIGDDIAAIRSRESMNQRLFDSLHTELLKYRDDFLRESLQRPFIHDLINLYDDLSSLLAQLHKSVAGKEKRGRVSQWHDNLENAVHSLIEVLHRLDVREIEPQERVDLAYHRVISYEPTDAPEENGRITARLRWGFIWRGKLVRPEEVIAKRCS